MAAKMILTNGRIYTMDPRRPRATAVAIDGGRIVAVGNDVVIKDAYAAGAERIDLDGRCVTPGLVDAHVHFRMFSLARRRVDLDNATSLEEVLQRIAGYAEMVAGVDPVVWLQGHGWQQDSWRERRFPTAVDLDRIVSQRPACMVHKSGHAAWANTRALRLAGITAETPDPPGGQIQRDEYGQPTGVFFEDAIDLITNHIPEPSMAEVVDAMRDAQAYCWTVGLTGIHDFDGRSCFLALQHLHENQELGLRIVKNIPVYRLAYCGHGGTLRKRPGQLRHCGHGQGRDDGRCARSQCQRPERDHPRYRRSCQP